MGMDFQINSVRRLENFIKRVSENEVVWGLEGKEGWFVCESNEYEDTLVLLFWSDRAYATRCIEQNGLTDYEPSSLTIEEFTDQWLYRLEEDGLLVGLNWTASLIGLESEPMDIVDALEK